MIIDTADAAPPPALYRDAEEQIAINLLSELFEDDPGGGIFNGIPYTFVLQNRESNLWQGIREAAVAYFDKYDISWHKGSKDEPKNGPEGHLLSSNVSCINHLFFLRQRQDLAALVLKNIDSRIVSAELIEDGYAAFEVMEGKIKNPLGENERWRKRGESSTSVDAVMIGKKSDGRNILFLIEWKYTEDGKKDDKKDGKKIESRQNIYNPHLEQKDCPIKVNIDDKKELDKLYYEPIYQLMRQTLLGWKMAKAGEYDCDEYIHLHIIPAGNNKLRTAVSEWKKMLINPEKYKIVSPEELLQPLEHEKDAQELLSYLKKRYWKRTND